MTKTSDMRNGLPLATWEDEGGNLGSVPCDPDDDRDAADHALPPGYEAQPMWGFHDDTGRFSYQFHYVYRPPVGRDRRGPLQQLDEQLSYWEVTWPTAVRTVHQHSVGRSLTYAQAQKLRGPNLTFEQFSSMRYQLPDLLEVGEVAGP